MLDVAQIDDKCPAATPCLRLPNAAISTHTEIILFHTSHDPCGSSRALAAHACFVMIYKYRGICKYTAAIATYPCIPACASSAEHSKVSIYKLYKLQKCIHSTAADLTLWTRQHALLHDATIGCRASTAVHTKLQQSALGEHPTLHPA